MLSKIFNKPKIYVSAWIGGKNFGDDYLAKSVFDRFKNDFKQYKIIKCSLDISKLKISENDVLIIAGGGLWGPSHTNCLDENLYRMWSSVKGKVILLNLGIESISEEYYDQLKDIVKKCSLVSFRDDKSYKIACSICNSSNIYYGADSTFLSPEKINNNPVEYKIGLNLVGPETENFTNNYSIDNIVNEINNIKLQGYKIICVPFSTNPAYDDYKYCFKIDKKCYKEFNINAYKNVELFIGMRFHSILIALQNNIPVIAICYSDKVKRLMSEYGLQEFCIDPNSVQAEYLLSLINKIRASRQSIEDKIIQNNMASQKRVESICEHIKNKILF